ncbi:MAG: Rpn family recombination-promoting nuclease/putative transposase [Alphaproteobacteria bacterium]|nr:Rpn family recombination-promoting nuclease/putative transposase [Alphaproteobacteria bacterium]
MINTKFIKHIGLCFAILLAFEVNTHATDEVFTGDGSRKRERSVEKTSLSDRPSQQRQSSLQPKQSTSGQTYGIATYDALFKWVLSQESVQPSFFNTFLPNLPVKSIKRLNEHMNPIKSFQHLRETFVDGDVKKTVDLLKTSKEIAVHTKNTDKATLKMSISATKFLENVVNHFDDFQKVIPRQEYDGAMDFVCELDSGEFALVEMQVIPQNHWDQRALAYVAAFYGNQLRQGDQWKDLKKVIGINILGGGKDALQHWGETPDQFIRHYKVQEQKHQPTRFIEGIEIIQYSLMNAPKTFDVNELRDWICFFKEGANMSEDDVQQTIKTKAVRDAFSFSKISSLPADVKKGYDAEEAVYNKSSEYIEKEKAKERAKGVVEGIAEGELNAKIDMVRNLIVMDLPDEQIAKASGLPQKKIEEIRAGMTAAE